MQTKEKNKIFYLSNDLVFKYIFGTEENVKYVEDLLESFYNLESGDLKELKILNSVKLDKKTIKEKNFEMDILIELNSGELINLEMYNCYDINAERKSSLYISKVMGSKALKASEKYDLVRRVSQINIVKKDYVHQNPKLISKYTIINEEDIMDRIIPDLFKIYIINLDQKEEIDYTNINKRFKLWLELLDYNSKEKLEKVAKKDKLMGEVVEEMKRFSEDEWVQDYTSRDRLIESQHDTALKETEKKAKTEREQEIAKNLLNENIIPLETIARATNLTIDEVKELKTEIKEFSEGEWVQDYTSRDRLIESQHDTALKNAVNESKEEMAKRLLTKNIISLEEVSEITNLSIEELKELKNEI